jgi:tape measure domain-containing protein
MIDGEIGVKINVDLDSEAAIKHAAELNEHINKQKPSVKVQADTTAAKEQIKTLSEGKIEKTVNLNVTETELNTKLSNKTVNVGVNIVTTDGQVEAALKNISKHSVPVELILDSASVEKVNEKTQQAATTAADQLRATLNAATTDSVTRMLTDVDKAYKQITSNFANIQSSVTDTLRNIESMQSQLDTALTKSSKVITDNAKATNKEIASSAQLSLDVIINSTNEATKAIESGLKAEATARRETVDIVKSVEQEKTAVIVAETNKRTEALAVLEQKEKSFVNLGAGVTGSGGRAIGGTYSGMPAGLSMSAYPDQSEVFKRGDYSYGGIQSTGTTGGTTSQNLVPNGAAVLKEAEKKALDERFKLVMESEERLGTKQNELRDFYRQADANRDKFMMGERIAEFEKLLNAQEKELLAEQSAKQSAAQKDAERLANVRKERSELNSMLLEMEQRRLSEEESLRNFNRQADLNAERMRVSEMTRMYDALFAVDNTLVEHEKRMLAEKAALQEFYRNAELNAERTKVSEMTKMYNELFQARKSMSEAEFLMQNAGMTAQGYAKYKEPQNYVAIPPQMATGAIADQTIVELAKIEKYQQMMASQQEKLNAAVTAKDIATREDAIHRIETLQQGSISRMLSMINESTTIEERYKIDAAVKIGNAQINENKIVTESILRNIQLAAEAEARGFEAAMTHRVANEKEMFELRKADIIKEAEIQQIQDNAHYADMKRQREERGQMLSQGKAFVTSREDISILQEYTKAHSGLNTAMGMVHNTMGMVTNVLMQLGVYLSARQLLEYADHWMHFVSMVKVAMHQMVDGLERVTGATEILNAEQRKMLVEMKVDEVFKISQDTRTSLEGTATLFSRMSRAVEAMGMGNDKAMILTKELGQALMIMGLNTQNARGALLQLEQALGGVVVRGQEFKSINDGIPIVMQVAIKHYNEAKAALKGMNEEGLERGSAALEKYVEAHKGLVMSLPQGRELMLQGKMYSAVYAEALLRAKDELNALSKDVEVTFGQSFAIIENAFTKYLGKLNESSGVSKDFAELARKLADNFDTLGSVVISLGAGIGVFSTAVIGSTLLVNLWNMALSRNPIMMVIGLVASLGTAIYTFRNTNTDAITGINASWDALWKTFDESENPIIKTFKLIGAEFEGLKNTITFIQEKFNDMQKSSQSGSYGFGMFSMPQLMARAASGETNNNIAGLKSEYDKNKADVDAKNEMAKVEKQLEAIGLLDQLNKYQGTYEQKLLEGQRILNQQVATNAKILAIEEETYKLYQKAKPAREEAISKAQDEFAKKYESQIRTTTGESNFKVADILRIVREGDLNSLGSKNSSNYMRGVALQEGLSSVAVDAGKAFDLQKMEEKSAQLQRELENFKETLPRLQESNLQYVESQNKMMESMYKKYNIGFKKAMVDSYELATQEIDAKTVTPRVATTTKEVLGYIDTYAAKFKVDTNLVKAVIEQESQWKVNAHNKSGATGLMQVMPSNFDAYGITDPKNIEQNIRAGVKILSEVLNTFGGDVKKALAGYNFGTGNFAKVGNDLSRVPAETKNYIPQVLQYYQQYAAGKEGKLAPEAIAQIQSLAGEYKKVTKEALVPDFSGQSEALAKLLTEEYTLMTELSSKAGIIKTKEEQADFELGKKRLATLRSLINDQESIEKEASDRYIKGLDAKLAAEKRTYEAQMVLINAKAKLQNEVELAALAKNKGGFAIAPIQGMMLSDTSSLSEQEALLADMVQQQKNIRDLKRPENEKILLEYERDILDANEKVALLKTKISSEQSALMGLLKSQATVEDDLTLANEKQLDLLLKGAKAVETANLLKTKGVTADSKVGQNIIQLQDQKEMLGFIEKAGLGVDNLSQSLSTMFTDMLVQGKTATQALGDMFKSMLNRMIGAAMDFIAQGIVKQLFSGLSGEGFSMGGSLTALAGAVAIGTYMGLSKADPKLNTSQTSMTSDYPNGIPADASSMQAVDMSVADMNFLIYSKEATQFNKDLRDGLGKGFSLMYKQSDAISKFAGDALQTYFPETMSAIKSAYTAFKESLAPITETVKAGYAAVTDYLGLTSGAAVASNLSIQASSAAIASLNTAISSAITPTTLNAITTGTSAAGVAGTGAALGTNASTNLSNAISNAITPTIESTKTAIDGAAKATKGLSSSLLSTIGFVASLGIEAYSLATSWDKLDGVMGKTIGVIDALGNVAFAASIATMGTTIASMNPVLLGIAAAASVISTTMSVIKDGFTPMNISRMVGMMAGAIIGTILLPGIGTLLGIIIGDMIGKLIGSLFEHQKKIDFGIIISKGMNAIGENGKSKYADVQAPTVNKVSKENRVLAMSTNMGDVYYGRTQGLDYAITKQEKEFVTRVGNTLQSIGNVVGTVDKALGNSEDYTRGIFRNIGATMKRVEASSFDAMKMTNWLFNSVVTNLQKTNTEAGRQVGGWLSVFIKNLPKEYTTSVILALTESKQLTNTKTQAIETTTILQKMATESPIGVLEFIQKRLGDMVKSKKTVQQMADETFKAISDSTIGLSAINEQFIKLGIVMDILAKKKINTAVIGDAANATTTGKSTTSQQDVSQTAGIVNTIVSAYKMSIAQALQYTSSLADVAHNIFVRSGTEANKIYDKLQAGGITEAPASLTKYPTTVDKLGMDTTKGILTYGKNDVYGNKSYVRDTTNLNPVESNLPLFQKFFDTLPRLTEKQLTTIETLNYGSVKAVTTALKTLPKEFVNQPWVMTGTSDDKNAYAANVAGMKQLASAFTAEYRNRNLLDITGKYSPTDVVSKAQTDLMQKIDNTTNAFLTTQKLMGKDAANKEISRSSLPDLIAAFKQGGMSVAGTAQDYGVIGTGDLTYALTTINAVADKYTADTKKALDSANAALVVANKNNIKADKIAAQKQVDTAQITYDNEKTLQLQRATQEVQNSMGLVFEMFISASAKLSAIFAGKDDFGAQAQAFVDALGGIDKAASAVDKAKKYALSEAEYTQMRISVAQNRVDAILKSTSYKTLDEATKAFRDNPLDVKLVNLMGAASDLADAMKKTAASAVSTSPEKVADFKQTLADWSTGLKITNLGSTKSQLDAAGVQYSKTLTRITNPTSDEDKLAAQGKITGVADSYLNAIKNFYGSSKIGVDLQQKVIDTVMDLPQAIDIQQAMLTELKAIKDGIYKIPTFSGISGDSNSVLEKLATAIKDIAGTGDKNAITEKATIMLTISKMAEGATGADAVFLNKIIESIGTNKGLIATVDTIVNAKLGDAMQGDLFRALNTGFSALLLEVNEVKLDPTPEKIAKLQKDIDKFNTLVANINGAVTDLALDPKDSKLIKKVQDAMDAMDMFRINISILNLPEDELDLLMVELKDYFKLNTVEILPSLNKELTAGILSDLRDSFKSVSATVSEFIVDKNQQAKAKSTLDGAFNAITATINSTVDDKTKVIALGAIKDTFANITGWIKASVDPTTQTAAYNLLNSYYSAITATINSKLEPTLLATAVSTLKDSFKAIDALIMTKTDPKQTQLVVNAVNDAYKGLTATVTVASKLGDNGASAVKSLTDALSVVTATINNVSLNPTAANFQALNNQLASYGALRANVEAAVTALNTNIDPTKTQQLKNDLQTKITALGAFTAEATLKLAQDQQAFLNTLNAFFGLSTSKVNIFANVDTTAAIRILNDLKNSYTTLTQTVSVIPAGDLATKAKGFVDTAFSTITAVINSSVLSDTAKTMVLGSMNSAFSTYTAFVSNANVTEGAKLQASGSLTTAVSAITATVSKTNLAPDIQTTTTAALNTALANMQVLIKDVGLNPTSTNQNTLLTQLKAMNVLIDNVTGSVTKLDMGSAANKAALTTQLQTDVNALGTMSTKIGLGLKDTAKTELDTAINKITPTNVSLTIKFTSWDAISKSVVDNIVTVKEIGDKGIVFNISLPDIGLTPIQNLVAEITKATTEVVKMISGFDSMLTKAADVQKAISLFATGNKIIEAYVPLKGEIRNKAGYVGIDAISNMGLGNYLDTITTDVNTNKYKKTGQYDVKSEAAALTYGLKMYDVFNDPDSKYNKAVSYVMGYNSTHDKQLEMDLGLVSDAMLHQGSFDLGKKVTGYSTKGTQKQIDDARDKALASDYKTANETYYKQAKDQAKAQAQNYYTLMGFNASSASPYKFADGGAFTNGIVTRPTSFDMGLMGEAGSEAIMPLAQTSSGGLGVRAVMQNQSSDNSSYEKKCEEEIAEMKIQNKILKAQNDIMQEGFRQLIDQARSQNISLDSLKQTSKEAAYA